MQNFRVGLLLLASRIDTSATDYRVATYMQLQRFNGANSREAGLRVCAKRRIAE